MGFRSCLVCVLLLTGSNVAARDDFDEAVSLESPEVAAPRAPHRLARRRSSAMEVPTQEDLIGQLEERARLRHQRSGNLMSQFMRAFSQNMKYAVLQDSKGDMPEEERLRQLKAIEAARGASAPKGASGERAVSLLSWPRPESRFKAEFAERPREREKRAKSGALHASGVTALMIACLGSI
ncbi:unnamed protein product [Effrenium voratum]|uniref:Transmembrane protein n=1 Tax=Effrenium voratum TaxID=2562239 RepID=A0AA36IB66_9DINO|nr:unnamed protein product [Effrenium voratum]